MLQDLGIQLLGINPGAEFVPVPGKHSRESWSLQLTAPRAAPALQGALLLPSLTLGRVNWIPAPGNNPKGTTPGTQGQTDPRSL